MPNLRQLLPLLAREALSAPRLARQPEPAALMEGRASVEAFHQQGMPSGPLLPIYRANARAASRLVRPGGSVLDLGSGSGQYLAYLAARRPDLRIIGMDLSRGMVEHGRKFLEYEGLADRVDLRVGDMTGSLGEIVESVDLVSTVFALHHLPTMEDLGRCLAEIAALHTRCGCAVWIFDHTRPRHPRTPEVFPEVFTPDAPRAFRDDSRNSLIASFSFAEVSNALRMAGFPSMEHHLARWMSLYQAHFIRGTGPAPGGDLWQPDELPAGAIRDLRGLEGLFPRLELIRSTRRGD